MVLSVDYSYRWRPRGVMVKAMDNGIVRKRVQTPVALLHSSLNKYPWERYEPLYLPCYGLNKYHYCSSRRRALASNNLQRLICH